MQFTMLLFFMMLYFSTGAADRFNSENYDVQADPGPGLSGRIFLVVLSE